MPAATSAFAWASMGVRLSGLYSLWVCMSSFRRVTRTFDLSHERLRRSRGCARRIVTHRIGERRRGAPAGPTAGTRPSRSRRRNAPGRARRRARRPLHRARSRARRPSRVRRPARLMRALRHRRCRSRPPPEGSKPASRGQEVALGGVIYPAGERDVVARDLLQRFALAALTYDDQPASRVGERLDSDIGALVRG